MVQHPGFEDIGKRMLLAWAEGVNGLRDRYRKSMAGHVSRLIPAGCALYIS
jgi:hypothetical protein